MKLIYVAGPFSGEDRAAVERNIEQAQLLGVEVAEKLGHLGAAPIVPHANTSHPAYERVQPYEFWIEATKELLHRCDAVLMHPSWYLSSGSRGEELEAFHCGIPVFYQLGTLERWLTSELRREPPKQLTLEGVR